MGPLPETGRESPSCAGRPIRKTQAAHRCQARRDEPKAPRRADAREDGTAITSATFSSSIRPIEYVSMSFDKLTGCGRPPVPAPHAAESVRARLRRGPLRLSPSPGARPPRPPWAAPARVGGAEPVDFEFPAGALISLAAPAVAGGFPPQRLSAAGFEGGRSQSGGFWIACELGDNNTSLLAPSTGSASRPVVECEIRVSTTLHTKFYMIASTSTYCT